MPKKEHKQIPPHADRMGRYIGQLRVQKGLTLMELSRGLCCYLNKIENGERQAGKLLMDAFFQRLGKPVDLFGRILNHKEFVKWTQRQEIISHLRVGNAEKARECAQNYHAGKSCVPDRQFLAIVEINCLALTGTSAKELLPLVTNALLLTQPDFGKVPADKLLLSQNEERLLAAYLQLREELEDSTAMAEDYRAPELHCEPSSNESVQLLIPCEEPGYVYCINQVIRSRRALLGFSQETLSDDACGVRSVSRIENEGKKPQRKTRKRLLQKVNMSGERYDCEIVSERYEDCQLSSEVNLAIKSGNPEEALRLLGILKDRVPDLPTNRQYILKTEAAIMALYPEDHPDRISVSEQRKLLEEALRLTLPLDLEKISSWPAAILSINEIRSLMMIALCYMQEDETDKRLAILSYIKRCLEITETNPAYYADIYTQLEVMPPEH